MKPQCKPNSRSFKSDFPRIKCKLSTSPDTGIGSYFPQFVQLHLPNCGIFYGYIHLTQDQRFIFEVDRTKELVDITDYVEIKY